jgi:Protein of unknown function (DUF3313)
VNRRRLLTSAVTAVVAALIQPAIQLAAAGEKPPQEWEGLVRRPSNVLDNVYVRPNVQFKAYKRIRLPPVDVSFAKDWDPNRGSPSPSDRISDEEIQKIRTGLSELFHEEFAKRLKRGGYTITDTNGDDVLIVQAALTNLYITGYQGYKANVTRMYGLDGGRVSVVMQLSDSVTQRVLAHVFDSQEGNEYGNLTISSSVASSTEARRIIDIWADALRRGLDEINKGQ